METCAEDLPTVVTHTHAMMYSCFLLNLGEAQMVPFEPLTRKDGPLGAEPPGLGCQSLAQGLSLRPSR